MTGVDENADVGQRLGYVPALGGLRGIAILLVVANHFFGLAGGAYGVDVFFVLSGFLITTILLEEHDRDGAISLRGFYVRRGRRLLPAMGALLAAVVVAFVAWFPTRHAVEVVFAGGFYAANIVRAVVPTVLTGTPLDHTWSLAQEEQFYLVWPLILIALLRRRSARIVSWLAAVFVALVIYRAALVGLGASVHRVYFAPDTHADGLVLGCLAAFLRRRAVALPPLLGWVAAAALVPLVSIAMAPAWSEAVGLPLVELAAAALVLAAVSSSQVATLLSLRPLVWLGAISYSLYLWQQPMRWLFRVLDWQPAWVALPASVAVAWVSYYLVEQPFRARARPRSQALPVVRAADVG